MPRRRVLPMLLAACLLGPAAPARAATVQMTAAANTFVPSRVTVAPGDSLELVGADAPPHNVVSDAVDRAGRPLFRSDTVSAGGRALVKGVEKLARGSYPFYCAIHPNMRGVLDVGTPALGVTAQPTGAVVPSATSIALHGDALYVTSYTGNDVTRLPLLPGGLLGPPSSYATGFDQPLGLVFGPDGTLFVADSHSVGSGGRVGRVRALPPGGGAAGIVGRVVVDGLPNGRHQTNGLAVRAGRLYIANGNNTDDGVGGGPAEQPLSGTLLSVPLSARNLRPGSAALVVEARGMRNLYDVAFRPGTADAWIPTNGPDQLDPYGEDLLHKVDVRTAAPHFGFPSCVYRTTAAGKLEAGQNPAVPAKCTSRFRRPETSFGLHVSANGLAFAPTTGGWTGDLYVAEFGSNTGTPAGHKVVRVPMSGGRAGRPQDVLVGAAPLDLVFGPPGTGLYVADFLTGAVTLVRPLG